MSGYWLHYFTSKAKIFGKFFYTLKGIAYLREKLVHPKKFQILDFDQIHLPH